MDAKVIGSSKSELPAQVGNSKCFIKAEIVNEKILILLNKISLKKAVTVLTLKM